MRHPNTALLEEQLAIAIRGREDAEARLQQSLETLGELRASLAHSARVTALGTLTASIAHEVNQPLTGIVTNASTCLRMLSATPPDLEGAREATRRSIRDGQRASQVIARLRAMFARGPARTEELDLNEATQEVLPLIRNEMHRRGIAITLELAAGLPMIVADRVQLQQVIINLLRNAAEALHDVTDRARDVRVRSWVDAHDGLICVCLSVIDSGVGLGSVDVEALFDAFHSTKPDGMGIGLSVSRWIIEGHGGRLWATANNGPGATFSFSIPHIAGGSVYDQCRDSAG
ncbi:MAG TPA: ATP-binding protein [Gemmatimonadaceae bacterium]|nr:ATP-binding protein [Gemmatimonadaceae bacterium]